MKHIKKDLEHILKSPTDVIEKQKLIELLKIVEIEMKCNEVFINSLEIYPLLTEYINEISVWLDMDPVVILNKIKQQEFDINEKKIILQNLLIKLTLEKKVEDIDYEKVLFFK